MIVEIGSGSQTASMKSGGIVTIDANPEYGARYCMTVPPLPDGLKKVTTFRAFHFWEHLYKWEADELAKEIYEALQPGGALVLELPDLAKVCKFIVEGETEPRKTEWALYGAQTDPRWVRNEWQAHRWGYTPASITQQLTQSGFERVEVTRARTRLPERDMRVTATKDV